jgi:sigma54-dependent transcription regulator
MIQTDHNEKKNRISSEQNQIENNNKITRKIAVLRRNTYLLCASNKSSAVFDRRRVFECQTIRLTFQTSFVDQNSTVCREAGER